MGTNYYLRQPAKVCGSCGHDHGSDEEHIGKSSYGWHFSFEVTQHKDLAEWRKHIDDALAKGAWIRDEYDQRVAPEEFWGMVEAKRSAVGCMARYAKTTCDHGVDLTNCSYS